MTVGGMGFIPERLLMMMMMMNNYTISLSLSESWPLENKVPMRSPYAFYPGVALR